MPQYASRERAAIKRKAPTKTFQCNVCSRSFARLEHVKRHETTHTNEKPFVCFCGRSFARKDLLKRHEQTGRHLISTPSSISTVEPQNAPSTSENADTFEPIASNGLVTATRDVRQAELADFPGPGEAPVDQYMFDSNAYQNFDTFLSTMGLNIPYELGNVSMFLNETVTHHAESRMHKGLDASTDEPTELRPYVCPYKITDLQRQRLEDALLPYRDRLGLFNLPSRLALSRHLTGYIEDYHNHLPFLHHIAFRNPERQHAPQLLLAVLASGAMSKYEVNTAYRLFRASKVLTLARWNAFQDVDSLNQARFQGAEQLETVQAAHLLTVFAMMHCKAQASQMTAELRDILDQYVRSSALFTHDAAVRDWASFVHVESGRRTLCAVFCALNMYTMMFDAALLALSTHLDTKLPCSTAEWTATNEREWLAAQAVAPEQIKFRDALSALFTGRDAPHLHSAFANLVLMHAILQRLFLLRQIDMDRRNGPLSDSSLNELEPALERWMSVWQKAPESILDPRNPDGSNSFTSASYLGLAYIRMYTDYASVRQLSTWNPDLVASNLFRAPIPQRSPRLGPALLHAMESLYILIKTGIAYSARSHFLHWDIQNFLRKLEVCAFLTKWLIPVADTCDIDPISDCESNIIRVLRRVIKEAEEALDPEDGAVYQLEVEGTPDLLRRLAVRVAHTWSCLFLNHNGSWAMIDLIGQSLQKYATLLANNFEPGHNT